MKLLSRKVRNREREGAGGWASGLANRHPSKDTLYAVKERRQAEKKIQRYNHLVVNTEENINRMLALERDLCCVEGCVRKHMMWTPKGKFCFKHKAEADAAMRAAGKARYGH